MRQKIWHWSSDPQKVIQLHYREHPDWLHHCLVWQLLGLQAQGTTEGRVYGLGHHWGQASCHLGPLHPQSSLYAAATLCLLSMHSHINSTYMYILSKLSHLTCAPLHIDYRYPLYIASLLLFYCCSLIIIILFFLLIYFLLNTYFS